MPRLPTVKVQHPDKPDAWMVVNESDFDPSVHKPWKEEPTPKAGATEAPPEAEAPAEEAEEPAPKARALRKPKANP